MASLSLPRVLQLKKNSLDAEREQFEKFQTLAIQKAINSVETPVKEKHVRSTIIGTFQEQSAITYWMVAIRLPLQDNRIVAWKFCHVTHKLLREGHPACLDDSQRHTGMIENLGKLWVHLREGYGKLVHLYCTLLVCKIKFHARNPRFPPNLSLTAEELDAIAENDVNNYFQLCVELFDYMDDILNLQAAVFDSLGNARANSMTASGQCRLAALIPCAQDSSQIYDCNVRLLFRLHASLPADTLAGHRERFRQQFKKLSSFYKHASSLQYYRNLLTLPVLPSNPPNFLLQSDFGTYVAPVVSVPEPAPDELDAVGSLIDTSDTISQVSTPDQTEYFENRATPSPQSDPIVERDRLIEHLQNELKRMRSELQQMVQERSSITNSMREHCQRLETQVQAAKSEVEDERQKAEMLSTMTPEIKQKLAATEEKARLTDEKFQKLKGAYTHLREEHITLIRQKAEVDKLATSLRASAAEHESAKVALQQQLNDKMKDVELLQQSASTSEEIEAYKNELANLRSELEQSRQKELQLETLKASMEALEIEHKAAATESEEKFNLVKSELKDMTENLQNVKNEKEQLETHFNKVKEELIEVRKNSGEVYNKAVQEKEAALKEIQALTEQYLQEKQEHETRISDLQTALETSHLKLCDIEVKYLANNKTLDEQNNTFNNTLRQKDADIKAALDKVTETEKEFVNYKVQKENDAKRQEQLINELQNEVVDLTQANKDISESLKNLEKKCNDYAEKLSKQMCKNEQLQSMVAEKNTEIIVMKETKKNAILDFEHRISDKVSELNNIISTKEVKIDNLQVSLSEMKDVCSAHKFENQCFSNTITELKAIIDVKDIEIQELNKNVNMSNAEVDRQTTKFDQNIQEYQGEIRLLKEKLENKQEIILEHKKSQSIKDEKIIDISVEAKSLANEVAKLEEDLNERNAELEITKNELLLLKEEYESIASNIESNLTMKNDNLRQLSEEVTQLSKYNKNLLSEKGSVANELANQKQVFDSNIKMLEKELLVAKTNYTDVQKRKDDQEKTLTDEINLLISNNEELKTSKEIEVLRVTTAFEEEKKIYREQLKEKETLITEVETINGELTAILNKLKTAKDEAIKELDYKITEKNKEIQLMESRLVHVEKEKLNAECELQDLLQHNSALEDNVAALKQELDEARKDILKQRTLLVSSAGEAAVEVTAGALAALDTNSTHSGAAKLASKAFEDMAQYQEVAKDAELIAKSAILAAHSTAQLSSYVTEVANMSNDLELSDKLMSECRSLLSATQLCMDSLKEGSVFTATSTELSKLIRNVARNAAAADRRGTTSTRSVDDELADMDKAIEEASNQIEKMLEASRKGDTGVKLEVNEKILDACTTLMGAVKILVQDARKLQNELGDPKTRQNMYRRNPQWSEGLISAAKAVVFAAKLLVTSSDEAVVTGRVENVSAAAHSVAGSTAQLVAASRARAPPASPGLARLSAASRAVAAATGAVVAAVRAASTLVHEQDALDTSSLTLTATRRLEMESKVRSLELETALEAERVRLAALRKRHYQLAQEEENGGITNGRN